MNEKPMTCADIDGILLDYFEGDLDQVARDRFEAHTSSCARCSGLVRDVNGIRNDAASLPELAPSRDLWQGIEARIQPAVVPIAIARSQGASRKWMAAAAAALIVSTASITYFATSRSLADRVAEATPAGSLPGRSSEPVRASPDAPAPVSGSVEGRSAPLQSQLASTTDVSAATAADLAYAAEIRQLQSVLAERRQELDPETIRVVEDNLKVIDNAVRQARAALAADPASGFLADHLNKTLEKKAGLLRTVALLPAST